jgi:hypothetical protein
LKAVDKEYFDGMGLLSLSVADKGIQWHCFVERSGIQASLKGTVSMREGPPMKCLIGDGLGFVQKGGGGKIIHWQRFSGWQAAGIFWI